MTAPGPEFPRLTNVLTSRSARDDHTIRERWGAGPSYETLGDGFDEPDEGVRRAASTLLWPLLFAAVLVVLGWVFL